MRLALLAVVLTGCGLVSFDVDQALPEQTVRGSALGGILPSFLPNPIALDINLKSETQKRGTGPATRATLKSLTLTATPHANPSGNFDFLDEAHILISAPSNPSLPKVEIATLQPAPRGKTEVRFDVVPGIDLLPYINAGSQIESQAKGTQPAKDVTFDGHVVVNVQI